MSRKRRRSQAFLEAEDDEEVTHAENGTENSATEETEELEAHSLEKEVWDAVREEHFEIIDQVPLTLHRQYTLMRELDQQTHRNVEELLPTLRKYIAHRRILASQSPSANSERVEAQSSEILNEDVDANVETESRNTNSRTSSWIQNDTAPLSTPKGFVERKTASSTGREMLSSVASLTEELVSAAQEKVNLAQAAHDYIDRQIRVLSQSIKEQEMAISLGVRPGTQLAPILLPDIVPLARWTKAAAGGLTLDDDDDNDDSSGGLTLGITVDEAEQPPTPAPRQGRRKSGRPPRQQPQEIQQSTSLKIILPAMQSTELYCYCNKPSSGKMVACDNENCEIEWFHLECIGLKQLPEEHENWYCDNCQPKRRKGKR